MGVIIKYQLEFPEIDLKVSNDLFRGELIIDADITATMNRAKAGGAFEIKLYDLPLEKAEDIDKLIREGQIAQVVINLGYFDGPFEKVMDGVIENVRSFVENDKLVTHIRGSEKGVHILKNTKFHHTFPGDATIEKILQEILKDAKIQQVKIGKPAQLQDVSHTFIDKEVRGKRLEILDELAADLQAELLVIDNKVFIGKPIQHEYQPPAFQLDENLAKFEPFIKKMPEEGEESATEETEGSLLRPIRPNEADGFKFILTGHPQLRPAQKVIIDVERYDQLSGAEFRIHSLEHKFTINEGYICQGCVYRVELGGDFSRRERLICQNSATSTADSICRTVERERRRRPVIEIGKVKSYRPEDHLTTLYYRQQFEESETQPSIRAEVDTDEQQLFQNKPIVSPFAWHKCGLVAPVYPGMKALLVHNLNLSNDALISGFIWSEQPEIKPPANHEGDWWLCLPIDFDTANPPGDSTKAVNDLIANNGKRVIEVKGLKITIGKDRLANVGERPSEGDDDEFLIEHKSGTKFTIDSGGTLTIEATNISIKGDVTIEGNVDII